MIELPEAVNLANQISDTIFGKRVAAVTAQHTPHKLAWYYGEPAKYSELLTGRTVGKASAIGALVEIKVENTNILFGDGVNIRFHSKDEPRPSKHQLLIEFEDGSAVSGSIQMYGGIGCFPEGQLDNRYYLVAKEKRPPLSPEFDKNYFQQITSAPDLDKLSLKALLATEQRIPGLGNGVLQDILFNARMNPKKKVSTLGEKDRDRLFNSVKSTLIEMAARGGRDTELDLFGKSGGYKTILSKNTANSPCPVCSSPIIKEAYMGGSVYYCPNCQKL
jgi:formamidopyrimidine-DNA glycosylase